MATHHADMITHNTHHGNFIHGMGDSKIYKIWWAMLDRCTNPNHKFYGSYGGRGITVSAGWHQFENFYRDMGERPAGKSLDRINNDGPYSKENCRWATIFEQAANRTDSRMIEFLGVCRCVSEWARIVRIKPHTLYHRLFVDKWPVEEAMTKPVSFRLKARDGAF